MDSTEQTRIATRIHHALLRHLGTGIDVSTMLSRKSYAREVLYVCNGCNDDELNALAREFARLREGHRASRAAPPLQRRNAPATVPTVTPPVGGAAQETPWAQDTSGFGFNPLNQANSDGEAADLEDAPERKRWFDPARWLRRMVTSDPH